jgi:geranylgeranyl pyrophosphate synthase
MPRRRGSSFNELNLIFKQRGAGIFERFGQELLTGIEDPKMSAILCVIRDNRKDWFRPALTSFSCEAVGGSVEAADTAGLMFSLLSTGISIHDDIIDKSPRKHFRVTLLGKYGLNKSLLIGDLLIVKGWAKIGDMLKENQTPEKIAQIAEIYGDSCTEMCEAEFIENCYRKKLDTSIEEHERMLWKAMAETEACTRIGAILGNGSHGEVKALAEFGRRLGYSSRLVDEIKDSLNIEGNLIHRLKYESVPLPLLFAAKSSVERLTKIQAILKNLKSSPSMIRQLLEICFECNAFSYAVDSARKNFNVTNRCLNEIKPSSSRDVLLNLNKKVFAEMKRTCDYAGLV